MSLGIAKVDKHAVAQILRYKTAETVHGFSDAFLIGRNKLSQVFRIHPRGEGGPTNDVREHHRDLPALGSVGRSRYGTWRSRNANRGCDLLDAFKIGNRTQELSAMPERRDTNLFEIQVGQLTQNLEIDIILGKALSVMPKTEVFEPVRNWLHGRAFYGFDAIRYGPACR